MLNASLESGMFSSLPSDIDAAHANRHLSVANEAVQRIKYARYVGSGLGVLLLIRAGVLVYGDATHEAITIAVQGLVCVALAIGSARAPIVCLGALLAIYIGDYVYAGFFTWRQAGWIIKVALLIMLGRGVFSAYRLRESRRALRALGVPSGQLEPLRRLEPVHLVVG